MLLGLVLSLNVILNDFQRCPSFFVFRQCKGRVLFGSDKHIVAEMVGFAPIFDVGQKNDTIFDKRTKDCKIFEGEMAILTQGLF